MLRGSTRQKYTQEQEQLMKRLYEDAQTEEEREEVVEELAERLNKNKKAIIAKLSTMRIYVRKERKSKVLDGPPETKAQLVARLEAKLRVSPGTFESFEKATKLALQTLLQKVRTVDERK